MADDVDTQAAAAQQSPLERAARALKGVQGRARFVCGDTAGNLDNPDPEIARGRYVVIDTAHPVFDATGSFEEGCVVLRTHDSAEHFERAEALNLRNIARAVLKAIRDCDAGSPAILVAGKIALFCCTEDPELEHARKCWQAMIDAALEEG